MDVFAELLKDDAGLLSQAVLGVTVAVPAFFIVFFVAKSGGHLIRFRGTPGRGGTPVAAG